MVKGILGRKIGMTQVFTKSGKLIPVTVIEVGTNVVTQIKTIANDGYDAIQLGFSDKREKLVTKASMGHTSKAGVTPKRFFKEIRGVDVSNYSLGQEIRADLFTQGEMIDVSGITKGKGFQGTIKRHNQSRGPMGHGSHYHRGPGSMGTMRPMRVFKGKALPGHMGMLAVTIQNLEVVETDLENGVILVKGNVPGAKNSLVLIKTSVKNPGVINEFEELNIYDSENVVDSVEETEIECTCNEECASGYNPNCTCESPECNYREEKEEVEEETEETNEDTPPTEEEN